MTPDDSGRAVAVITVVHGRHGHLLRQLEALDLSKEPPELHVIVAMGDPELAAMPHLQRTGVALVELAVPSGEGGGTARLPLARARNLGAATARAHGAEVLVFLDVDCLPAPGAVGAYAAAARADETGGSLLCGPVTYLDPPPPGGYRLDTLAALDRPHPARPAPAPGTVEHGGPHELFWSLSFALEAAVWARIGGFCERYTGYGGEDTDFAYSARAAGVPLAWIGSARAYHQHHPVSSPPVEHLEAIVRNARIFHERWGEWPMRGWLDEFVRRGLIGWPPGDPLPGGGGRVGSAP